jgi:ribosomal protein L11 methyltransferase
VSGFLALSVELKGLDPEAAENACFAAGALSVTLTDAVDDAILEPAPGELRLWPQTVLQAMFPAEAAGPEIIIALAGSLDLPADRIRVERVADRVWEREWLKDFHAMRFGRRQRIPKPSACASIRAWLSARVRIPPLRCASPGWTHG